MKLQNIYDELAENLIGVLDETFEVWLSVRLIWRSVELPTKATPDDLLSDVCETMVRENFEKLTAFRTKKFGACYMYAHEIPTLVESFKPLCVRAWPYLNIMLGMDRDTLFQHRDYITVMGRQYVEEAPSVTFVRFLNDMERLKEIRSETYERNLTRIAQVHALNRVANVMPKEYHFHTSGKLKPGQTIADAKWAEILACRDVTGIHTMDQLLELAGLS